MDEGNPHACNGDLMARVGAVEPCFYGGLLGCHYFVATGSWG